MNITPAPPFQLLYHCASSASLRVTIFLACRGVPAEMVELVSTGLKTDHRGIPVFTLPEGHAVTAHLGTDDLTALNREGRIPVLIAGDGRIMTKSGAIIELIESVMPAGVGQPLVPDDPWLRAEAQRIAWIIAADTQPYQNIPFIIQAIGEWGMVKAAPTVHPLRLHFIRREFGAIENILSGCAGRFAVGDSISHADCFLVPQVRNALLAGIDLPGEFPILSRVFDNMVAEPAVGRLLEEAGGVVQPFAFDAEKFEVYVEDQGS